MAEDGMVKSKPRQDERKRAVERERRERSLEVGLEDSMAASDPVAATQPAPSAEEPAAGRLRIEKHDKSDIVQLTDGSRWRVYPGDLATTLQWLPTTELRLFEIEDDLCSHALVNLSDNSRTKVIEASKDWPVEQIRKSLMEG